MSRRSGVTFTSAPPLPVTNLVPASHRASGNSPRWLRVAAWGGLIRHVRVRASLEGRSGPARASDSVALSVGKDRLQSPPGQTPFPEV